MAFNQLPLKDWPKDFGFRRYVNEHYPLEMGNYYCEEKDNFTLFQLLNYMDKEGLECAIHYYRFPSDMQRFVGWVWNNVALDLDMDLPDDKMAHQLFPFKELYDVFRLLRGQHKRVIVHKDKITLSSGVILSQKETQIN